MKTKFVSLICALIVLMALIAPAFAGEDEMYVPENLTVIDSGTTEISTVVFNEYDFIEEQLSKSTNQLVSEGYNLEEIREFSSYADNFREHLENLNSSYSDDKLKSLGYGDEAIQTIRNLDSAQDLSIASATCTIQTHADWIRGYYPNGSPESSAILYYEYSWNVKPFSNLTEALGIGWESSPSTFHVDPNYNITAEIWYWIEDLSQWDEVFYYNNWSQVDGMYTRGIFYPLVQNDQPGPLGSYAKEGEGSIRLRASALMPDDGIMDIYFSYIHQKHDVTGSIGLSFGGIPTPSIGMGFSLTPDANAADAYHANPIHIIFGQ
ncbi:hypothetical protein [Methanolapillus ohkumae]|uniref:Uncharacterized protein n=1 Tax=Methanolapillus ohkumae TaxID=3028298 RepID=A0AA96VJL9_9EURY|nr:hypothetical protein MsAm2_14200 [Methanosarcinaceae archaeon Am2]